VNKETQITDRLYSTLKNNVDGSLHQEEAAERSRKSAQGESLLSDDEVHLIQTGCSIMKVSESNKVKFMATCAGI
jgi:hypothetical protein